MDAEALRGWLGAKLKRDVPDPLWDYLVAKRYVRDALEVGDAGRADLLRAAREEFALARALRRRPGFRQTHPVKPPFGAHGDDYAGLRAAAADEAVAALAGKEPRVVAFRSAMLGGRFLSWDEAWPLFQSFAAARFDPAWFRERGVPVVGHGCAVTGYEERVVAGSEHRRVELRVTWSGGELPAVVSDSWPLGERPVLPRLIIPDEEEDHEAIPVAPGSVLDTLRELSAWLSEQYAWPEGEAAWFVLSGQAPESSALDVGLIDESRPTHHSVRITLSVEPWVPAGQVLEVYRDVQKEILGRENRPLSRRKLRVLRFVLERRRADATNAGAPARSTWSSLAIEWNAAHPDEAYGSERNFARDAEATRRAVLFPGYWTDESGEEDE